MRGDRRSLGRRGETLARRHLESRGYSILEVNYRTRRGEIDLIARDKDTLVFVEVRTRGEQGFGSPEESVTPLKRAHLVAAAQEYIQANHAEGRDWRIDVVAIETGPDDSLRRLDVLKNAVEL